MACASCGGKRAAPKVTIITTDNSNATRRQLRQAPTLNFSNVLTPQTDAAGNIILEYLGPNVGSEPWYGPTGRRYRFGRNARHIRGAVNPADVQFILDSGLFRVVSAPAPAATAAQPVSATALAAVAAEVELPYTPDIVLHPENYVVADILAAELPAVQWALLAEYEAAGKNRVTVLNYAATRQ